MGNSKAFPSLSNEVQNYLRLSAFICVQLLLLVPHLNGNGYKW